MVRMLPVRLRFSFVWAVDHCVMTGSEDNPLAILAAKESVGLVKVLVAGVVVLDAEVTMEALRNLTARVRGEGVGHSHLRMEIDGVATCHVLVVAAVVGRETIVS